MRRRQNSKHEKALARCASLAGVKRHHFCFIRMAIGGHMNRAERQSSEDSNRPSSEARTEAIIRGFWGVRYQVKDVSRSVSFYTGQLGFKTDRQVLPAFAQVSIDNLKLILSGPGASGSRPMPDGTHQE